MGPLLGKELGRAAEGVELGAPVGSQVVYEDAVEVGAPDGPLVGPGETSRDGS